MPESDYLALYTLSKSLIAQAKRYARAVDAKKCLAYLYICWGVEDDFEKYFNSKFDLLNNRIGLYKGECFTTIKRINFQCAKHGKHQINDREKLLELLLDSNRRTAWRQLIDRHEKANTIFSLQDLEREYQKSR